MGSSYLRRSGHGQRHGRGNGKGGDLLFGRRTYENFRDDVGDDPEAFSGDAGLKFRGE
ncbi:MAG: hypothetical protein ACRDWH_07835 [Acidimicrobiia bacterium]